MTRRKKFYIDALTRSCGSPKSFNVDLLVCNDPLLSPMRCSWNTRFSIQAPAGRLFVFSRSMVRSLLLVSKELQEKKKRRGYVLGRDTLLSQASGNGELLWQLAKMPGAGVICGRLSSHPEGVGEG